MNVILYLLLLSLALSAGGLCLFLYSLRSGQYRGHGGRRQPHPVRRLKRRPQETETDAANAEAAEPCPSSSPAKAEVDRAAPRASKWIPAFAGNGLLYPAISGRTGLPGHKPGYDGERGVR